MRIRNLFEPRSGMEKIRIRVSHPRSATLRGGTVKIIRGRRNRKAVVARKTSTTQIRVAKGRQHLYKCSRGPKMWFESVQTCSVQ
jgi:hypothetical protein